MSTNDFFVFAMLALLHRASTAPLQNATNFSSPSNPEVHQWLDDVGNDYLPLRIECITTKFNWSTNMTNYNSQLKTNASARCREKKKEIGKLAKEKFPEPERIQDPVLRFAVKQLQKQHNENSSTNAINKTSTADRLMQRYSTASICPPQMPENCSASDRIHLRGGIVDLMATSRNETELRIIWKRWRDVAGKASKKDYFEILLTRGVYERNATDELLHQYEMYQSDFRAHLNQMIVEFMPFYENIHAYVRHKLRGVYGNVVPSDGPIPAHLLGNMWAQSWGNIFDIVAPFPAVRRESLTKVMQKQNWTVTRIFKTGEEFFKSLGMPELPPAFWENSMLTRPNGRNVSCHGSAWNIADGDKRIRMCAKVHYRDFATVHHELGHIYYYLAYENQTVWFQYGANNGFHEALGDTILLSSEADAYLKQVGLLDLNSETTQEQELNQLMRKALRRVALIPYAYVLDLWRWDVYSGKVNSTNANDHYWSLRRKYQGVSPPVERTSEDFDPPAKYHVSSFTPFLRYAIARFLQFDFHDALCRIKGDDDVSKCTIFADREVGHRLWNMMRLGSSKPWPDALETITGRRRMTAEPLLKYFKKLNDWLVTENQRLGLCVGWGADWPDVNRTLPACPLRD